MKKVALVFSLMMLLASCTQEKIGYVKVEEILKEYEGSIKAEEDMKAQSQQITDQLDQLAKPLQQKIQAYQENKANLSASARQAKEAELMKEQQSFQQQQQRAQQQIQVEGQRMYEKLNNDIESFLTEYGQSNGYTYILGSSVQTKSVLYGKESLNITDEVIDALNADYQEDAPAESPAESSSESSAQEEEVPVN